MIFVLVLLLLSLVAVAVYSIRSLNHLRSDLDGVILVLMQMNGIELEEDDN